MKKVLVAMSGGVDSSVAAALLKKQGYCLLGVFIHFWSEAAADSSLGNKCCSPAAQEQARRVAQKIGIPFYTINYIKPFGDMVVENYIAQYQAGRTPNPCVLCNQFIKFDLLLNESQKQGCDYLATGHYARIAADVKTKKLNLKTAIDKDKDQSYFLYRLTQQKLKKIIFPIGDYRKTKVRQMAREFGLPVAETKDSRGICFVSTTNEKFLKKYLKVKPGLIVDVDGVKIGDHQGLLYYTVGQRHGYGSLNLKKSTLGKNKSLIPPLYVVSVKVKNNTLVVGREEDLYQKGLIAQQVSWISGEESNSKKIGARIRYRHPINQARIKKLSVGKYQVIFSKTQRAITPGQSVVFYNQDQVLGGGIIEK